MSFPLPGGPGFMNKWLFIGLVAMVCFITACTTRGKARRQAQEAFSAGQQQAITEQQRQGVWVRGDVKNPFVPWHEGMTLAEAVAAAEYQGLWDPHEVVIIRGAQRVTINVRRLLQGIQNPPVEPGDIVELKR